MARIYQDPQILEGDIDGGGLASLDAVSRRAVVRFWLSIVAVILGGAIFYGISRQVFLPKMALIIALTAAAIILVSLVGMSRSLRKMRLVEEPDVEALRKVKAALQQLDDRFAVFSGVRAGDVWIDHLIVGPSGAFAVRPARGATTAQPPKRELDAVHQQAEECRRLVRRLVPGCTMRVEPVLVMTDDRDPAPATRKKDIWIVGVTKIAPGLIKRSGQVGAITQGVNETGAFSSDSLQSAAVERELVRHWEIPAEKTERDYGAGM